MLVREALLSVPFAVSTLAAPNMFKALRKCWKPLSVDFFQTPELSAQSAPHLKALGLGTGWPATE